MSKRFRLSDLELDFVSLVDSGDDPMAQVVLSKAAPDEPHPYNNTDPRKNGAMRCDVCGGSPKTPVHSDWRKKNVNKTGDNDSTSPTLLDNDNPEDRMPEISKDDLDPSVVAYIDALESEVETLSAQVEKSEKDLAEKDEMISKMAPKDSESAEEIEKALLSKAAPEVRALIEKSQAEARKAQEIAKAERVARLTREYVSKAEALPMINEGTDDLAGLLRRAAEALTPEDSTTLETVLKAANEQIAKGNLFTSLGSGGAETTISKSVQAAAAEIKKEHPDWTDAQAEAEAFNRNPDLLGQALTEQEA